MKVGMVGIGLMGHGIASNIVKHGHSMVLFEHPGNQSLDVLKRAGAQSTDSLKELAQLSDVIILCVTGTPEVEDVLFRDDGLLDGVKPGTVIVDCSTAIPSSTERVAVEVTKRGASFLDAPMTRTPKEAAEGRLNLTVGGDKELFESVKPLLQCYAENIVYAGPVGSGHRLKLLHNFVSLGFSAVLAEAAACASRANISADVFLEVVGKGGGDSVVLNRFKPYLESGDGTGFRFYLTNALKDMNYYTAMAEESGSVHDTAESIRRTFEKGTQVGTPQATVLELVDILSKGYGSN
ncbi:NAD(P)-dependent oxidoreductase [Paraburkholderia sp. Ac-20340]|uniref:NAD(P)-dependent oxidoreductase n=1 Tax=Paraburkholderia sp. Ac-20340 TaxID=2703888 RepID=UPI00198115B1|nr:NAD(P)-dependent oxidoreductase [Paraburkholderia sp. Ac-20340]MBN3858582.1 NAD(P)-dependent oxidoreductase [Paraburkholderia sp. Ac-20340]